MLNPAAVSAQELPEAPEGYEYVDSLVYVKVADIDSTYVGLDILGMDITQSDALVGSMRNHMKSNPGRSISGYRVRIFFDNKQTARTESQRTLARFESMYPGIGAYRTYTNSYFMVTVGNCRTKSEAMAILARIKKTFPNAFIVKESIRYPVVDRSHTYEVDTVRVLRPIKPQ
jgi:hypothetical protein